jgi:hypothetical protein
MSSSVQPVSAPVGSRPGNEVADIPMKVNRYDRVAGVLVALLVLIGGAVGVMLIVWLTTVLVFGPAPVPIKLVENVAGRGDHAAGFARDLEPPGEEEMPELQEPQIQTALEAVTDAVSSVSASMDVYDTSSVMTSKGKGGLGDSRPPGPEGEGDNIIPRWERWEIRYISNSVNTYAQQLDFFKIELGAAGGKPQIDYASGFSRGSPTTRQGTSKDEKRLYMTWKSGTLKQYDQQLLGRASIPTAGRMMMQFYPEETEDRLAWIEMENAKRLGHPNVKEFLRTIFGVRPAGSGFEFHVIEQRFRPAPP